MLTVSSLLIGIVTGVVISIGVVVPCWISCYFVNKTISNISQIVSVENSELRQVVVNLASRNNQVPMIDDDEDSEEFFNH